MEVEAATPSLFGDTPALPAQDNSKDGTTPARSDGALYRRYRSRDFNELVGQEPIVRTLKNAISSGRLAHAYLFSGPRGTGKTSMARLLAKAVNCLQEDPEARPCNQCSACVSINEGRAVDLIEIDAASNRGVDDVRDLRDRVRFSPAELRKKFYIIDEVHMMTTEAFNALLKTLEEPPPHVIFVLATTDPQKLPATVLSRCQRFDFRRFPLAQIVTHMRHICESEGYQTEQGVLELIGRQAAGGMRDALSLLDQLMSYSDGTLKLDEAARMLGARSAGEIASFVDALIEKDMPVGLRLLRNALDNGADMRHYNRQLIEHLRSLLLLRAGGDSSAIEATQEEVDALREQAGRARLQDLAAWTRIFADADSSLRNGVYGALPLELALVEAGISSGVQAAEPTAPTQVAPRPVQRAPERAPERTPTPVPVESTQRQTPAPTPMQPPQRQPAPPAPLRDVPAARDLTPPPAAIPRVPAASAEAPQIDAVVAVWPRLVEALNGGGQGRTLAAMLRNMDQGWPHHFEGDTLVLGMKFPAHRQRVENMQVRRIVEDHLTALLGTKVLIRAEVMSEDTRPKPVRPALHALPPRVQKAAAIFEEEAAEDAPDMPEPPDPGEYQDEPF